MNFLSHLYLSGNSEGIRIGNFIADAVKGSDFKKYTPEIQAGILLHRRIDSFTDSHLIVERSKQRLRTKYRKYAGVIVDVYYDHYLAKNWSTYSGENLNQYAQGIYTLMQANKAILPLNSARFTQYMIQYNILASYADLSGIDRVLKGMARRTTFESNMEHAIHDLTEHYNLFEEEFKLFFPELKKFVEGKSGI